MATGKKTGGRKKGTPNKKTQDLLELIETHHEGFNPVVELINTYKDENTPLDLKVSILKDVMPYMYPKRKSIEHNIEAENNNFSLFFTEVEKKAKKLC